MNRNNILFLLLLCAAPLGAYVFKVAEGTCWDTATKDFVICPALLDGVVIVSRDSKPKEVDILCPGEWEEFRIIPDFYTLKFEPIDFEKCSSNGLLRIHPTGGKR